MKKQNLKRLLSVVMCMAMVLVSLPVVTSATTYGSVGYYSYKVSDGEATITEVNTSISGSAIIPSTLGGYPVTSIGDSAFSLCLSLTSIEIPNSVKAIGNYAFSNCVYLTSITIPNSVTSIGVQAFSSCRALTSIEIPSSVTSIGFIAFEECRSLKNINVDSNNTNYSSDDGVLYNKDKTKLICCPAGKTSIDIPNSVTSIENYAFYGCKNLTSVEIPNSVTSIGNGAFCVCSSLTSITFNGNSPSAFGSDAFPSTATIYYYEGAEGFTRPTWNGYNTVEIVNAVSVTGITLNKSKVNIGVGYTYSLTATVEPSNATNQNITWSTSNASIATVSNGIVKGIKEGTATITATTEDGGFTATCTVNVLTIDESLYGYTVSNGKATITYFKKNISGAIAIPLTLGIYPVVHIDNSAFYGRKNLTSITMPDGVTSIGNYAFHNCTSLRSIEIPNSVTSIGNGAFYYCESLESVEIPDSVTSIASYAFSGCTSLTSIEIPNSVTNIGNDAFNSCYSLTSVEIPDSVTSIGDYAFYGCKNLTSITIPDGVTSICNSAFSNCDNLKSVEIPDSVTSIGNNAFSDCDNLKSVEIPNSVTSIGSGAFSNCDNLISINVDNENQYYTSVDGVLYNEDKTELICCPTGKTSVEIPNSVTSIGDCAFIGCTSLASIEIPNGVTSIGSGAFNGCTNLASIEIPDSVTSIGSGAFTSTSWYNSQADGVVYAGKFAYKYKGTMPGNTNIVLKEGTVGIVSYAFSDCTNLTSLTIPNGVMSIGNYAFYNCTNLTSLTIPNGVMSIGNYAFYNCTNLTSLTILNGVTSIGDYAFKYCYSLTSVEIPDSVTSIGFQAFYFCTSLESVEIPDSVTSIGNYAFSGCKNLTSVEIPNSVTSIGSNAFESCTSLASIEISDGVTNIGGSAFSGCTSLTSIEIPNSVTSIGYYAFSSCTSLASMEIPNSVTSISNCTFYGCTNLTSVTMPNDVTSIGEYAFSGCTNLSNIRFYGTEKQWNNISGLSDACIPTNCTITFLPVEVKDAKYYASLTLNDNIDVNFKVKTLGDSFNKDLCTVTVDGVATDFTYNSTSKEISCVLKAISPKNISKTLDVVVKYDGTEVKSFDYSIREYCESAFSTYGVDSNVGKLCKAVLNYGKWAEDYFSGNSESTINDGYATDLSETVIPTPVAHGFTKSDTVSKASASLILDSEISLNFKLKTTKALTKDNIKIVDEDNNIVSASDITVKEIDENGYNYLITINHLSAGELAHAYTLTINDVSSDVFKLTYGVYSYCYNINNQATGSVYTETLKTLCKAIYAYGEAAKAYNANPNG